MIAHPASEDDGAGAGCHEIGDEASERAMRLNGDVESALNGADVVVEPGNGRGAGCVTPRKLGNCHSMVCDCLGRLLQNGPATETIRSCAPRIRRLSVRRS